MAIQHERNGLRAQSPRWLPWLHAVALVALGLLAGARVASQPAPLSAASAMWWPLLVGAFAAAQLGRLDFRFRGESQTVTVYEIVLVVALSFFAPPLVVAAAAVGAFVAVLIERAPLRTALCTLGARTAAASLAVFVFHGFSGATESPGPRYWFSALVAVLASSAVLWLAALPRQAVVPSATLAGAGAGVNALLGLLFVVVLFVEPMAIVLLAAPTLVVFVAYRAYISERRKSEGLRFLYGASQVLAGAKGLDATLLGLLGFARETLQVERAEVVVYDRRDDGTAYVTTVGPGESAATMIACDRAQVEARVSRSVRGQGAEMAAPFSVTSGISGAVLVGDAPGAGRTFKRDDRRLLETFAAQLVATLEKSQLNESLAKVRVRKNELAHEVSHDSLTGLANRSRFRQYLAEGLAGAASTGSGLAVLFIDLDDFKTVNDTMGHAAGDELLCVVGRRIASCVGPGDVAARLGGDEFAVLLTDVANEADIQVVADRILLVLGDPTDIDGRPVFANASIGAATHAASDDPDVLMQNADVAMYTAKRNGKGRCDFFEPSLHFSGTRRREVEARLQRALDADELVLHYQPVVDVARGDIVAIEALVRWCDPARGLLPPSEFIGVAEETGLIVPIGHFVLREACGQAATWSSLAPDVRIFVNLSPRELSEPDLIDHVARILAETGLDPSRLILEVTDAGVMRDITRAQRTLEGLKRLGVGIGLDDIAPGYPSLQHLRHLPLDVLKIAKPWIDAIGETEADTEVVRSLVELGHSVGLHVVAEGLERVEQAADLLDIGCDWAQGYYYARSLESEAIVTLLCRTRERAAAAATRDRVESR